MFVLKIAIVSDTHGCAATWQHIYETYMSDVDSIIHAGDILYHGPRNEIPAEYNPKSLIDMLNQLPQPFFSVQGNCDSEVDGMVLQWPIHPSFMYLQLGRYKIVVQHGHTLTDDQKVKLAQRYRANLFISGHTHLPVLASHEGVTLLNPGSPAMPKTAAKRGSFALLFDQKIQIVAVDNGEVLMEENYGSFN